MEKLIIASMRPNAGKTSILIGLAKALGKKSGYIKPFGDRMIYKKKRTWDYDSSLVTQVLGLNEISEDITIGFDHSKIRYMHNEENIRLKLNENCETASKGADFLFIEGGEDITYGSSVHLDVFSLAKFTGASVIFILSGRDDAILDDITFLKKYIKSDGITLKGVIFNKVQDTEDFKNVQMPIIMKMGIPVLGIIPFNPELSQFTANYLSGALLAKVVAGEDGLSNIIKEIFVGSISTDEAFRHPIFSTPDKLLITSGDRSDLILASLNTETAAIILTNNLMPQPNILAMASEKKVPLLLVTTDTYKTAKMIEQLEPLIEKNDASKISQIEKMVRDHVDLSKF
jgi:BioD-like phosphotransacetylase family protein